METPEMLRIQAALHEMGLLFSQYPGQERIHAYAKQLINYSPKQITYAFKKIIFDEGSDFFPSLPSILKFLQPDEITAHDRAPEVAAEMIQAVRWYGRHDETRMLANVSEEARDTFIALGDTTDIRNSQEPEIVRAQLERLARSVMKRKSASAKNEELNQIGIESKKILPLKRPGMNVLSFKDYSPTEGA